TTRSPRSTVGTATEIYDYLRLLFARIGRTYCLNCGTEVRKDTVDEVAEAVLALGEGTRLNVLFPVLGAAGSPTPRNDSLENKKARRKKPDTDNGSPDALKARLFELRQKGFNRLFQRGQIFEFSTPESLLDLNFAEPVFVLVDRIAISSDSRSRL